MVNAEESTKAGLSRLQDDARPTICSDSLELISNIAEVGLDEILQNEFLKDIPVISSLVSIYKIGNNIHNAHLLKKYACFLDEFNRDSFENGSWNKYKQYFEESNRKRDIEYLLILLERYIEEDKARRLAKIYEAYLDKEISWDDLRLFAETLDRFLPGDYEMLREKETFQTLRGRDAEVLLRLTGLGLLIEDIHRQQWDVVDTTLISTIPTKLRKKKGFIVGPNLETGWYLYLASYCRQQSERALVVLVKLLGSTSDFYCIRHSERESVLHDSHPF